jgi:hypothetical protein
MTPRGDIIKNIDSLIARIGPLKGVLDRLEAVDIRYGLYFLVHDDDIDELKRNFPSVTSNESESESGTFAHVDDANQIEFMGRANICKEDAVYPFRLTDLAVHRLDTYTTRLGTVKVVNPADTLLLKAILRRGESQGKRDLEDMQAMIARVAVDVEYLKARIQEARAAEITADMWHNFGLQV